MRSNLNLIIAIIIIANTSNILAQDSKTLDSIKLIKEFKNIYQSGDYYFGGQPTLEAVNWLKSEGVKLVINLRADKENEAYTSTAFNEENLLQEYGIKYISIPVSYPDSYTPETLDKFAEELNNQKDKVFIHCAGGGRVKYFFMAYLIKYKEYSINDAISFCKQMNYSFPLENLLGKEINMSFKE